MIESLWHGQSIKAYSRDSCVFQKCAVRDLKIGFFIIRSMSRDRFILSGLYGLYDRECC